MFTRRNAFAAILFPLIAIGVVPAQERAAPPSVPSPARDFGARTALITGANRGIGLEYCRQLQAAGWSVIGTARKPDEAAELEALGVRVEALDVTDSASVSALAQRLKGVAIDLLINNAGIGTSSRSGKISEFEPDSVEQVLAVNLIGPMRVTQALLPNLHAGKGRTVVSISSRLGSVELNTNGGYYGYRESKAGLNMFMRSLAMELKGDGFVCVAMSPGWVRTDMGGPQATLSAEESVGGMLKVIAGLMPEDTGTYFSYDGQRLPW